MPKSNNFKSDIILEVKPKVLVSSRFVGADGFLPSVEPSTYVELHANDVYQTHKSASFHDAGLIEVVVGPYDPSTTNAITPSCETYEISVPVTLRFIGSGPVQSSTIIPSYSVAAKGGVPDATENEIVDEIFLGWETALLGAGFERITSVQEPFFKYVLSIGEKQTVKNQIEQGGVAHLPLKAPQPNIQPILPITHTGDAGVSLHTSQTSLTKKAGVFWDSLTLPKAIVIASVMFFLGTGLFAFAGNSASKNFAAHAVSQNISNNPITKDPTLGSVSQQSNTNSTKRFGDAHADQVNAVLQQMGVDTDKQHDLGCLVE